MIRLFFAAISMSLCFPVSAQTVITTCGAPHGWRYQISPGDPGWVKDGINDGFLTLTQGASGDFDVIVKDRVSTTSLREDKATVIGYRPAASPTSVTVLALYPPGDAEVMQFTLDVQGRGELLWSIMKPGSGLMNVKAGSLLKADCKK